MPQVKPKPRKDRVEEIRGRLSDARFVEACPDQLKVYPQTACNNGGCPFAIKAAVYLNCSFVVSATGGHSLREVGEFMGLTYEGVRRIEGRALELVKLEMVKRRLG